MKADTLIFDLDGTLLVGEDLSDTNRQALLKAKAAGYTIIIATARWVEMAQRIAAQLDIATPLIACSGAQVFDPVTQKDIFDTRLPADFTDAMYERCNGQRCIATITLSDSVLLKLDGEPDANAMGSEMTWVPKLQMQPDNLPRIGAIQGTKVCEQIKQELYPQFADRVNLFDSIGPTGRLVITLTAKQATKGEAVKAACQHLQCDPGSAIAFGDAENDLAMFNVCGQSVAMGQASDMVKSAATVVTGTNTEHGVAQAVNRLLETGSL